VLREKDLHRNHNLKRQPSERTKNAINHERQSTSRGRRRRGDGRQNEGGSVTIESEKHEETGAQGGTGRTKPLLYGSIGKRGESGRYQKID